MGRLHRETRDTGPGGSGRDKAYQAGGGREAERQQIAGLAAVGWVPGGGCMRDEAGERLSSVAPWPCCSPLPHCLPSAIHHTPATTTSQQQQEDHVKEAHTKFGPPLEIMPANLWSGPCLVGVGLLYAVSRTGQTSTTITASLRAPA